MITADDQLCFILLSVTSFRQALTGITKTASVDKQSCMISKCTLSFLELKEKSTQIFALFFNLLGQLSIYRKMTT
jgi:hypothetical protein